MKNIGVLILMILMCYANAAQMKTVSPANLKKQLYSDTSESVRPYKARGLLSPLEKYCKDYLKGTYHSVNGCTYLAD